MSITCFLLLTNESIMIIETLKLIKNSARIMHPLPHVEEIDLPIKIEKEDKRVAYFRQSENGLYIRMALLKHIIK